VADIALYLLVTNKNRQETQLSLRDRATRGVPVEIW